MRLCLCVVSLSTLLLGSPLQAEDLEASDELQSVESEEELRELGWNQWVCTAYAPGYVRPFYGWSYWFREGSGEGQEARSIAHLTALRQCQFQTGQQCRSRLESDCRVRRY